MTSTAAATPPGDARQERPDDGGPARRRLRLRCLGPLGASMGDTDLALGGPKQRLVLAHLLIRANATVPVDRLIGLVWGDDPPAAARQSLQTYISHLRRTLGADRISGGGQGYALRVERDEVDRLRFEALVDDARRLRRLDPAAAAAAFRQALDLWTGPPFADLYDVASLLAEITRLEELRAGVVEDRVRADIDLGRHAELIGELEALTAEHPLRERLWGQLMVVLYRSGRQGDALAAFERARALLADELGLDPSVELRSLHERVLRQDPSLRAATPTLKGYQLLERVGEGRFGVVWRARQPGVDRDVAIKAAWPTVADDPGFIRRFAVEAQRVARIEHPHVVPLYDFWREPGGAYLVQRYLRGGTLRALVERSGTPERDTALRIADQVTQALAAAHRQGVVHADVTPDNVLFDDDGNAFLTGFAIAYDDTAAAPVTAPADRRHLAPERAGGAGPDLRSDVFALGVVLSDLLPDRGPGLVDVLGRATARHAADRQPTAATLLVELRAVAASAATGSASERGAAGTPTVVTAPNPYKGLRAFDEGDAADFFGRDAIVARLLTRLREPGRKARFLAVVGPSGSGKSSTVHAGLIPALRAGSLEGSDAWFVATMVPGHRPLDELATALRRVAVDAPDDLTEQLAGDRGLATALPRLLSDDAQLLLVVDQFEELFTLTGDEADRRRFIDTLGKAVTAADGRLRVIVTLRADFYDRPLAHPGLAELVRARTEAIVPMDHDELREAISGPAARVGVTVDPILVTQIVADVVDQPGGLPLLQFALTELFDGRRDGALTVGRYRQIGGITGALARRAEAVYAQLPERGADAARQLFLNLASPGDGAEDLRRRANVADVTGYAPEHMPGVLSAFGGARLLSFDRDPETRAPTVEVAHEALLREWRRLRDWIATARDDLRVRQQLQAAAADWDAADRDPSFLATGSRLDRYEAWRTGSGLLAGSLELDYLDASVARRDRLLAEESLRRERELDLERRSVQRLRVLVAVLGIAAAVAAGLTILAVTQGRRAAEQTARAERQSRVATARELSAAADANLDVDPERSTLLAIQAVEATRRADRTVLPEAEQALHDAVDASRVVLRVPDVGGSLDWSPAGDVFVTEGPEDQGIIDLRDATTGASVRSWHGHDVDVNDVAFDADGSRMATTGDDGALRVWDTATGDMISERVVGDEALVWGPSFSPDGTRAAAVWDDGTVRVIDTATGRPLRRFHQDDAFSTAFSPDGRQLGIAASGATVRDLASGRTVHTLPTPDPDVTDIQWSPDGRWIATSHYFAKVRIYDAGTGEVRSAVTRFAAEVHSIDWSADARHLAAASGDGTVRIFDVSDGGLEQATVLSAQDLSDGAYRVAFSPDGTRVMASDVGVEVVLAWDLGDAGGSEWAVTATEDDAVVPMVAAPDGRHMVVAAPRHGVQLWDPRTGRMSATFDQPGRAARYVAAGGGTLAAGFDDGTVTAWDVASQRRLFSDRDGTDLSGVAVSDDGRSIAFSDFDGHASVVDLDRGTRSAVDVASDFNGFVSDFSPDGSLLTVTEQPIRADNTGRVQVWDLRERRFVQTVPAFANVAQFASDGRRIVTAELRSARVWDVATGKVLTELTGHLAPVYAATFSPDGSQVATGAQDGTVRVWDADTGIQRLVLRGHEVTVASLAFSADGRILASAGGDGVARSWALDLRDLTTIAEHGLTRGLTTAECRQYLHTDACPGS